MLLRIESKPLPDYEPPGPDEAAPIGPKQNLIRPLMLLQLPEDVCFAAYEIPRWLVKQGYLKEGEDQRLFCERQGDGFKRVASSNYLSDTPPDNLDENGELNGRPKWKPSNWMTCFHKHTMKRLDEFMSDLAERERQNPGHVFYVDDRSLEVTMEPVEEIEPDFQDAYELEVENFKLDKHESEGIVDQKRCQLNSSKKHGVTKVLATIFLLLFGFSGYTYVFREHALEIYAVRGSWEMVQYLSPFADTPTERCLLAFGYLRIGKFTQAEALFYEVLSEQPSEKIKADVRYSLGQLGLVQDNLEEAEGFLTRASKFYQENRYWKDLHQTLLTLSSVYDNMNRISDAEKMLSDAHYYWMQRELTGVKNKGKYLVYKCLHSLRTKDFSGGLSFALEAIEIFKDDHDYNNQAIAQANAALTNALLGDMQNAIKLAHEAQSYFTNSKDERSLLFVDIVWLLVDGPNESLSDPINDWIRINGDPELKFQMELVQEIHFKESSNETIDKN